MVVVVRRQDQTPRLPGQFDDRPSVSRLEGCQVEHLARIPEGDLPVVDAEHAVEAMRLLEVVPGDNHPASGARQLVDQSLECGGARCVESGERLVEEQQICVLHQPAGDQHALALPPDSSPKLD